MIGFWDCVGNILIKENQDSSSPLILSEKDKLLAQLIYSVFSPNAKHQTRWRIEVIVAMFISNDFIMLY